MVKLYGRDAAAKRTEEFADEKIKLCLYVISAGLLLAALFAFYNDLNPIVNDKNEILREDYEGLDKTVTLKAESEDDSINEEIKVNVAHRVYKSDELNEMARMLMEEIEKDILGQNKSTDSVAYPLELKSSIDGYPFKLSWRCDKPLVVSRDGSIDYEKLKKELENSGKESLIAILTLTLTYEDYKEEEEIPIAISMPKVSSKEKFIEDLNETIYRENEDTKEEKYLKLPGYVNDTKVYYAEDEAKTAGFMVLLTLIAAVCAFGAKDNDIQNKIKEKYEEMEQDYPKIVNQYTLYYCAGMHTKSIWHEICRNYLEDKKNKKENVRYAFEEMVKQDIRMSEGIGEINAYESFSRAVALRNYRTFISIIEQSLEKGKDNVIAALNKEADNAQKERLNRAKILGEKAGTKMLLPMFIMLGVVLVIIIFPAFVSFQM